MLKALKSWRRQRIITRSTLDDASWNAVTARYAFLNALSGAERARLREWVALFLHQKTIQGAAGLAVDDDMRACIAAQACVLVLNLDLDYYRGWVDVIVYPDEFVAEYDYVDEDGIAHHVQEPMSGESWLAGPVVLSWADAAEGGGETGYNVVIHEFAHKLDMLNGDANGFPPLHGEMTRAEWSRTFSTAYEELSRRVDAGQETSIDPYAAESPAEFFAVLSEAFFEIPRVVHEDYPGVYGQLAAFYRQDPAARAY